MTDCKSPLILGIDIGTSGTKAIVFNSRGRKTEAGSTISYQFNTPVKGAAELDPEEIISAVVNSCREAVRKSEELHLGKIMAVGLSGFWHSLIAVGKRDEALTPVYTWVDRRSYPQSLKLRKKLQNSRIHRRTGCILHPVYLPSKILWLKEKNKVIFRKTRLFCSMKEYLILRLFGQTFCDFSTASGTGLLNIQTKEWDKYILEAVGISQEQLSPLSNFDQKLQGLMPNYSRRVGLSSDVPWVIGAGDGACSSIGSGCISEEKLALMIGTSGAVRVMTHRRNSKLPTGLWCYLADREHYLIGGAINNAGLVRHWLKNILNLPLDLETVLKRQEPSRHALTFLPFLSGERCPGWRASAKASILGLTFDTSPEEIFRAGLESVGYRILEIFELMRDIFPGIKEIVVSGGVLQSPEWVQIITDILGIPLSVSIESEASCLGAAVMAMRATGTIKDYNIPGHKFTRPSVFKPSIAKHNGYMNAYRIFKKCKYLSTQKGVILNGMD